MTTATQTSAGRHTVRNWRMGLILLAAVGVGACGSSATAAPALTPAAPTAAPAADGTALAIANFAFDPASVKVKAGASLTWTNNDGAPHTVTADDGSFASGRLAGGATFSFAFAKEGTYTYHCAIHTSMTGTVTVTP